MAEGSNATLNALDDVVCRFFATSFCKDGANCLFSHDKSRSKLDNVCRFYLQGRCVFGSGCRYDHVRIQPKKTKQKKHSSSSSSSSGHSKKSGGGGGGGPGTANWVNAPEFIPKSLFQQKATNHQSYADAARPPGGGGGYSKKEITFDFKSTEQLLCPYFTAGECSYGDTCSLIHGEKCDICNKACLVPFDEDQHKKHREACCKELEKDMEESFAIQRSIEKSCGICFDVIMKKNPISDRRFGILEKCNHVFCLKCIRTWRKLKNNNSPDSYDPEVIRACPECRVPSDFVTPSKYWIENEDEKQRIIKAYKEAMSKKPCQYFKQGRGTCPFGGACFYLHAKPDGTKVDLPPPVRRRRFNQDGELDFADEVFLRNFLELRDEFMFSFEFEDFHVLLTDSDDSERSFIMD